MSLRSRRSDSNVAVCFGGDDRVVVASYIEEVQWDMRMGFIGGVLDWLDW